MFRRQLIDDPRHIGARQKIDADIGAEHPVHGGLVARRPLDAAERCSAPAQGQRAFAIGGSRQFLERRVDLLGARAAAKERCDGEHESAQA